MKYTEKLLKHPEFLRIQCEIAELERGRIYCHHEISHALDVCRMAWIMYLESCLPEYNAQTGIEDAGCACKKMPESLEDVKDWVYVSGLLHDIGRAVQYESGEHHAVAGGIIAKRLLNEISYPTDWMNQTLQIVTAHHGRDGCGTSGESGYGDDIWKQIGAYIQKADHLSRNCFCCAAAESCKWKEEERNQTVLY